MTDTPKPRSNELSPVVFMGSGGPDLTAPERVERFTPDVIGSKSAWPDMTPHKTGGYVRYPDYEALADKLKAEQLANGHEKRLRLEVIAMEQAATARAEAAEARALEMEGSAQAALAGYEVEREARQKAEAERDALDAAWSERVALLEKAISEAGAERDVVRVENALLREAVIEAMDMDCAAAAWTILRDALASLKKDCDT